MSPLRLGMKTNCSKLLCYAKCQFLCAGMMEKETIFCWGIFLPCLAVDEYLCFFIYGIVFLTEVCIFQRNYLLHTNSGLFV